MPHAASVAVEYLQGLHVADSILWFDAPRNADLCFLSHAHVPLSGSHQKILLTEPSAALLSARLKKTKLLVSPFYRRFSIGGLDLELFPAGHMLGAAQIRVTREHQRLVYTGDFQLESPRIGDPAQVLETDRLLLNATYGASRYRFPPRQEEIERLLHWLKKCLAAEQQPVLLAANPGKAQELTKILADENLSVRAHRSIYHSCQQYAAMGFEFPNLKCYRQKLGPGEVLIFPPQLAATEAISRLPQARTAVVSGKSRSEMNGILSQASQRFVISGHADQPALIRYAEQSGARQIYLAGAGAGELAVTLRSKGLRAWPIEPPCQRELFSHFSTPAAT